MLSRAQSGKRAVNPDAVQAEPATDLCTHISHCAARGSTRRHRGKLSQLDLLEHNDTCGTPITMMVSHEITAFTTPLFCAEAMFESLNEGQTAQDVTQGAQDTLHHRGCRHAHMARRFVHAVHARAGWGGLSLSPPTPLKDTRARHPRFSEKQKYKTETWPSPEKPLL